MAKVRNRPKGKRLVTKHYTVTISPAISIKERGTVEKKLEELGFSVTGGGSWLDDSCCDISMVREEAVDA